MVKRLIRLTESLSQLVFSYQLPLLTSFSISHNGDINWVATVAEMEAMGGPAAWVATH